MFQMYFSTVDLPFLALPARDATWGAQRTVKTYVTGIPVHTDRALTAEQMARGLDYVSRSSRQQSVPLKHGIDYSKGF
jgi:hypothetical protein